MVHYSYSFAVAAAAAPLKSQTFPLCSPYLKRLHLKEITSKLVGLSFHGLDEFSLYVLETEGTTADKLWKE